MNHIFKWEDYTLPLFVDLTFMINVYLNNNFSDGYHLIHFSIEPLIDWDSKELGYCVVNDYTPQYPTGTIKIKPNLNKHEFRQVIMHELFHAITWLSANSILCEYITYKYTDLDNKHYLSVAGKQLLDIVDYNLSEFEKLKEKVLNEAKKYEN